MKILSLLLALAISLRWPQTARWRRYDWLMALPRRLSGNDREWLPVAALAAVALAAGWLASAVAMSLAGLFGLLVLGTAVVLYTIGPHSLDRDIALAADDGQAEVVEVARERLMIRADSTGAEAAAAALHAALARWFGIVFWFALLGPAGCLLYRGIREIHHGGGLAPAERSHTARVLAWLNWPVVALLVCAIALMTDLDRVRETFLARPDRWRMPAALLDDLARALCDPEGGLADGLADGRRLAWRAMGVWLAVLSLLLLAGLLS